MSASHDRVSELTTYPAPVPLDWLAPTELRIGLGCMRLSTDDDRDERRAHATIAAAVAAGITVFDTARAYGRDATELGHNERLLAAALAESGHARTARIVTKGGMTRAGGSWVPDGRAKAIRADCEASLAALNGLAIDISTCCMRRIHARRGRHRCARSPGSSTTTSCPGWGCPTSIVASSTRPSGSPPSAPWRSRSACRTTTRCEEGSWSDAQNWASL